MKAEIPRETLFIAKTPEDRPIFASARYARVVAYVQLHHVSHSSISHWQGNRSRNVRDKEVAKEEHDTSRRDMQMTLTHPAKSNRACRNHKDTVYCSSQAHLKGDSLLNERSTATTNIARLRIADIAVSSLQPSKYAV